MIACNKHAECLRGLVQGPTDIWALINCMVQRGILKKSAHGKYFTDRTPLLRR